MTSNIKQNKTEERCKHIFQKILDTRDKCGFWRCACGGDHPPLVSSHQKKSTEEKFDEIMGNPIEELDRIMPTPKTKERREQAGFLQVGRNIECGSCFPNKYPDCIEIRKGTNLDPCNCICHSPSPKNGWEKEFDKICEFTDGGVYVPYDKTITFIQDLLTDRIKRLEGLKSDVVAESGCEHEFKFSHLNQEAI